MDDFTNSVFRAVKKIPKGKVCTYKDIAEHIGNCRAVRAVGNALHKNACFKNVPCYRVVNFRGECAENFAFGNADVQRQLLEQEGIKFVNGRVDLKIYRIKLP